MNCKKIKGDRAEKLCSNRLVEKGFTLVCKNFHSRYGEIDIIAKKGDLLVFIEVKARSNDFYSPEEAVNFSKMQKLKKTAEFFLMKNPKYFDYFMRFDVCAVYIGENKLEYIENAF